MAKLHPKLMLLRRIDEINEMVEAGLTLKRIHSIIFPEAEISYNAFWRAYNRLKVKQAVVVEATPKEEKVAEPVVEAAPVKRKPMMLSTKPMKSYIHRNEKFAPFIKYE